MNKKYYEDQGLTALETTVEDIRILNDKKWYAFKDSIIYPGGGGQIPDKAKINGYEIAGVYKDDDFTGFRFNENCSFDTGDSVKIEIDADFRQYNRQQHTAQHLISAVMDDLGFKTVSVHLGEEYTLIEIEGGIPDNEKIRFIENRSNEIIHQALPVKCEWLSTDEAQKLPLRKKPGLYDALRIVSIDGIDYSACGGTHVDNTSQIGLIKFINLEKIRGNARLQFFVGKKAYEYFSQVHEMERKLVNILQTAPEQLEQRIQNLIADKTALTKSLANLKKKWLPYEAESILKGTTERSHVYHEMEDFPDQAEFMAKELFNRSQKSVLLIAENRFYYLCTPENDSSFRSFIKLHGLKLGMRGGGPIGFLQGMFDVSRKKELRDKLKNILSETERL